MEKKDRCQNRVTEHSSTERTVSLMQIRSKIKLLNVYEGDDIHSRIGNC